jgi:uncharacterized protein (TIGR00266 family)
MANMTYEILYQPVFSVVKVTLEQGESIRAEGGAMMSMSVNVELQSKGTGGLGKMLGRMVAGESLFQSTFTAVHGQGEVILAPGMPGDVVSVDVSQVPMIVMSGAYLAGSTSIQHETKASMKGFLGGEGLFLMRMYGHGFMLLSAYGAIHTLQLAPGQKYIVDSGHLVAFQESVQYNLKKAAKGLLGTLTSGEGLVAELTGPGLVYTQTRTMSALLAQFPARG